LSEIRSEYEEDYESESENGLASGHENKPKYEQNIEN
jgi:hypothetical protein